MTKSVGLMFWPSVPSQTRSDRIRLLGPYDRNKSNFRRGLYCPEMQDRLKLV